MTSSVLAVWSSGSGGTASWCPREALSTTGALASSQTTHVRTHTSRNTVVNTRDFNRITSLFWPFTFPSFSYFLRIGRNVEGPSNSGVESVEKGDKKKPATTVKSQSQWYRVDEFDGTILETTHLLHPHRILAADELALMLVRRQDSVSKTR